MSLLILSFFAWILTILAPCVLPLLPIILWASASESQDKSKPYIIIISLALSIIVFTLLLKASTIFIDIDPIFWKLFSWWIIIIFWIITLFPNLWKDISTKLWFSDKSNRLLWSSSQKSGKLWSIAVWFSLWPVFSSCSPTYTLILAVVLPQSFTIWLLNLFFYTLWLCLMLLLIAILWQKFVAKLKWLSDPNGIFKKLLWILFIIVWLAIITWLNKTLETYLLDSWFLNTTEFETGLIDKIEIDK